MQEADDLKENCLGNMSKRVTTRSLSDEEEEEEEKNICQGLSGDA